MNINTQALDEQNIDQFIVAYNQAQRKKAKTFPFENNEIPTKVAKAILIVLVAVEGLIHGNFDENGIFTKAFNPQLN